MYKKKKQRPETFDTMWIVSKRVDETMKGKPIKFLCSDEIERTIPEITVFRGIHYKTILLRIRTHGLNSPLVLHPGPLSQEVFDYYGITEISSKIGAGYTKDVGTNWDRSRCRRNNANCKNYSDCQSSRLKMAGYPEWVEPKDTDVCFTKNIVNGNLTKSSLDGFSSFIFR